MSNPLFTRIKIGKSTKDPTKDRLDELNRETGSPEKYKCEYYAFVWDEHGLEFSIHKQFSHQRPNPKREFFEVSIPEAIIAIRKTATKFGGIKYEEIYYTNPEDIAEADQAAENKKTSSNQTNPDQPDELEMAFFYFKCVLGILGFIYILAILDKNGISLF